MKSFATGRTLHGLFENIGAIFLFIGQGVQQWLTLFLAHWHVKIMPCYSIIHIGLFKCHSGVSAFLKSPTDNFFWSFVKIFMSFLFLGVSQQ